MEGLPDGFRQWSANEKLEWFRSVEGQAYVARGVAQRDIDVPLNRGQEADVVEELAAVGTRVQNLMQLRHVDLNADAVFLILRWIDDEATRPDIKTALVASMQRRWPPSLGPAVADGLLRAARDSEESQWTLQEMVGIALADVLADEVDVQHTLLGDATLPTITREALQSMMEDRC